MSTCSKQCKRKDSVNEATVLAHALSVPPPDQVYTQDIDLYPSLSLFPWSVVRLGGTDHEIGDKRRYRSNPLVYLVFGDLYP